MFSLATFSSSRALTALLYLTLAGGALAQSASPQQKAIEKAIAYLAKETPNWRTEHRCASCHHQGNAVRALLAARAKEYLKDDKPLENSLEWLTRPAKWPDNHGDPNASDQALADLQFGASLMAAETQFAGRYRDSLTELARLLAKRQAQDGRMELEASDGPPTPITLGPILLTAVARDVFQRQATESQKSEFTEKAKRANDWLIAWKPRNTLEASSLLLALKQGDAEKSTRTAARKIVLASAHSGGGFGPYVNSPDEVFDTALAILALCRDEETKTHRPLIEKAKKQLVDWQRDDGSWEETTRPSGGVSYAHRIATTAWALEALLE